MKDWININIKPPPENTPVLVYGFHVLENIGVIASVEFENGCMYPVGFSGYDIETDITNITYWKNTPDTPDYFEKNMNCQSVYSKKWTKDTALNYKK